MTEKKSLADSIIRNHVVWSCGAGMIPVPLLDIGGVSAIQLDMVRQLCKVYSVDFSETQGKAMITTMVSSSLAKMGARVAIKLIPGIGSVLGGLSMAIMSGASTYALGQVYKTHLENGGTILDFEPSRFKKYYAEQFEKGKKVAEEVAKDQPTQGPSSPKPGFKMPNQQATGSDVVTKLRELAELRDQGILTEDEFAQMKKQLIDGGN